MFDDIVSSPAPGTTPDKFFAQSAQTARAIEKPAQANAPQEQPAIQPQSNQARIEVPTSRAGDWMKEADEKRKELIDGKQPDATNPPKVDWETAQPKTANDWKTFKAARETERAELLAQIEAAKQTASAPEDYAALKAELEDIKPKWQKAEDYFSQHELERSHSFQAKYSKVDELSVKLREQMKEAEIPEHEIEDVLTGGLKKIANFIDRKVNLPGDSVLKLEWYRMLSERASLLKEKNAELSTHKERVADYRKQDAQLQAQQRTQSKQEYVETVDAVIEQLANGMPEVADPTGRITQQGMPANIILQNPDFKARIADTVKSIFGGDAQLSKADIVAAFTSHITSTAVMHAYQAQMAELADLRAKLARVSGMQPNTQSTSAATSAATSAPASSNGRPAWHDTVFASIR